MTSHFSFRQPAPGAARPEASKYGPARPPALSADPCSMPFLNISTYRFVPLDDLPALRDQLEAAALAAGLKGTILVAREGINLFVAGREAAVRGWVADALHWRCEHRPVQSG